MNSNIKERNYLFDNLKALLIFSVVVAHYFRVSESYEPDSFSGTIYLISFSYIMQAFLFVSGYFSKNVDKCRSTAFKAFLFPYLVLMPIMYFIRYMIFGEANFDIFLPSMALWYLLTMFIYRFSIKTLAKVKYILPISFLISIAAGLIPFLGEDLALGRTFGFLPFFMLGYFFKWEHIKYIRSLPKFIFIVLGILLVGFSVFMASTEIIPADALLFKESYDTIYLNNLEGIIIRILLTVVSLGWIAVFLNLVPEGKFSFTSIGKSTMAIYVLHIVVRYVIKGFDIYIGQDFISDIMIIVLATLSVVVFSRDFVVQTYDDFMDNAYDIFKRTTKSFEKVYYVEDRKKTSIRD